MSCFILSPTGELFNRFGALHSTKGKVASEYGYDVRVTRLAYPAWLYVRHQQADSAIHKDAASEKLDLNLQDLGRMFGVDCRRIEEYQKIAQLLPYSIKRVHENVNKELITFSINDILTSSVVSNKNG